MKSPATSDGNVLENHKWGDEMPLAAMVQIQELQRRNIQIIVIQQNGTITKYPAIADDSNSTPITIVFVGRNHYESTAPLTGN